ncbi:hypothetical protein DCC79_07655 [bacterium]|nr:MAG: hypothetical protein DCC79_07655 [bacterium]
MSTVAHSGESAIWARVMVAPTASWSASTAPATASVRVRMLNEAFIAVIPFRLARQLPHR